MKYYAGLDVSLEETAICIVDESGGIVRELRAPSDPACLAAALRDTGLELTRIGLEACSQSAWLHDGLAASGLPAVCLETRGAKAAMGAMPNKTDRNDARGLAQIVRTGWYRAVHVKSEESRMARSLLVARRTVLNKLRDMENAIRAALRESGLKLGTPGRKLFATRVRELAEGNSALGYIVEPLLAIIAVMTCELERLTRRILAMARAEPVCRQMMTVPGVGALTAFAFRATVDRPERFRRSRDAGAHLGLTPRRYQSGETDIQGRISRCGDELARTLASHGEIDAVWRHDGSAEGCADVERLSSETLKRTWTGGAKGRDWFDLKQAGGRVVLQHASQVKNVWIPYGV